MPGLLWPVVFEGHKKVMSEPFSWAKFLGGIVDPTAYFKTLAIILRIGVMIILLGFLVFSVLKVRSMLWPEKRPENTVMITGQTGGEVHNVKDDKKFKIGLLNLW